MTVALGETVPALGQGLVLGSPGAAAVLLVPPDRWETCWARSLLPSLGERIEKQFQVKSSFFFFSFVVDVEAAPLEPFSEIVLLLFSANAVE